MKGFLLFLGTLLFIGALFLGAVLIESFIIFKLFKAFGVLGAIIGSVFVYEMDRWMDKS